MNEPLARMVSRIVARVIRREEDEELGRDLRRLEGGGVWRESIRVVRSLRRRAFLRVEEK